MRNSFAPGEFYHLYSRGIEKRSVFMDGKDHERFIRLLFFCNGTKPVSMKSLGKKVSFLDHLNKKGDRLVDVGAYCLMPNHFHILIRDRGGSVTTFMRKLMTAYTMYFNKKYERTGRLFESSFKSTHIGYDEYLKYLFAYIHLNPLKLINSKWREEGFQGKASSRNLLEGYVFSSFKDYCGESRNETAILNKEAFPEYFSDIKDFTSYLDDWMDFTPEVTPRG